MGPKFRDCSSCGDSSHISRLVGDYVSNGGNSLSESEISVSRFNISHGGHKYYIPKYSGDISKPEVNQSFDSLEKGIEFYKEYGMLSRFNVRLNIEMKDDRDEIILRKYIICGRAGFNDLPRNLDESSSKIVKRRRTVSGRCGCKAICVFKCIGPTMNIGTSKSFTLMKEQVGGYGNIGASVHDFQNFNRDLRCYVGEADAQILLEKFKVLHETCESFYYTYDVDCEGYLTNLFWADATARRNYELNGDVVSFDATFNTNRYNMIFAPFTGVDKHDLCVTFAACLLCHAMKAAVPEVFKATNEYPATKHRLCMWHIIQKSPLKLDNRLCKETDFMEKMKKFIWSSTIEPDEFKSGWLSVMKEFKLEWNKGLGKMYSLRKSWIPAYF
ncbi:protein FAR1-RELATED SEQUENCE 5-like [Apium graveolens]|uniref:protein FAR1-RELATED SEQUENCE 5-like n=1 Tax=Apium graveolens TaxID=4045 RepID=UPI003D7ACD02